MLQTEKERTTLSIRRSRLRTWAAISFILTIGMLGSSVIATVLLDSFARRPGPMSVTTLFPGFAYAAATIMKVCIVAGFIAALAAVASRRLTFGEGRSTHLPRWGITSVTLTSVTPAIGAIVILIGQGILAARATWSTTEASSVSRVAVIVVLAIIALGAIIAVISIFKRESPVALSVLGLVINVVLVLLFWRFEFYAIGFDQDTWAPR